MWEVGSCPMQSWYRRLGRGRISDMQGSDSGRFARLQIRLESVMRRSGDLDRNIVKLKWH